MIFEYAGDESLYPLKFTCKWIRNLCAKKLNKTEYFTLLAANKYFNILGWLLDSGCLPDLYLAKELFLSAIPDFNVDIMKKILEIYGNDIDYVGQFTTRKTVLCKRLDVLIWLVEHKFRMEHDEYTLAGELGLDEIRDWMVNYWIDHFDEVPASMKWIIRKKRAERLE